MIRLQLVKVRRISLVDLSARWFVSIFNEMKVKTRINFDLFADVLFIWQFIVMLRHKTENTNSQRNEKEKTQTESSWNSGALPTQIYVAQIEI